VALEERSRPAGNTAGSNANNMPAGPYVKIPDRYRHPDQSGLSLTIQNGAEIHDIVLVPEPTAFPP